MKKAIALLFLTTLLFMSSCNTNYIRVPDGVDTPPIVTTGGQIVCWLEGEHFTLTDGGFDIDGPNYKVTAADITINGWLEETDESSYYSATVNSVIFGDVPQDKIVFHIMGSTEQTFPNQLDRPQKGDRMIAILEYYASRPSVNPLYTGEPETRKYMDDMFVSAMLDYCDVFEHDGETYVFDQRGRLTRPVSDLALPDELKTELRDIYRSEFPNSAYRHCVRAFKYDDFVALLEKYAPINTQN